MKFTKMQGLGNDYVYVNCFEETVNNPTETAVQVSDRHFGIGSDGLLSLIHECFPNRVNTEFAHVLDRQTAEMRVWERGSGETLACGTGACAVAVACVLNGYTEEEVTVKLLGGELQIRWDREKDRVYMTGPAEVVFDGEWPEV